MDNPLFDRARAHMRRQMGLALLGPVLVPEWGDGAPAEIYYRAATSVRQQSAVADALANRSNAEFLWAALLNFALDKDGEPLFVAGQKQAFLREIDGAVADRVVAEIMQGKRDAKLEDAALKN